MTEQEKRKLELYDEMRVFIERIYCAGFIGYADEAKRLVEAMDNRE